MASNITKNDAQPPFKYKYQATDSADVVIKGAPGFLYAIIVGKADANASIEVSDHATDGDGNVKIFLEGAPVGTHLIQAEFSTGITADLIGGPQRVTFVYK